MTQTENEREIEEEVRRELFDTASAVTDKMRRNLIQDGKVDTGNLLKSIRIEQPSPGTVRIVVDAPHARAVEYGRSPGNMPPVDALQRWVERVLGVTENSRGVAFAVAKKIEERGIQPSPYARPALEDVLEERFG